MSDVTRIDWSQINRTVGETGGAMTISPEDERFRAAQEDLVRERGFPLGQIRLIICGPAGVIVLTNDSPLPLQTKWANLVSARPQDEDEPLEEGSSDEEEPAETLGPPCPVCGVDCQFDRCDHIVSSWSYAGEPEGEGGEWAGSDFVLQVFRESLQELFDAAADVDGAETIVPKLLPKRLHVMLGNDFWRDYIRGCCDDHLTRLIEAHPKYVGSEWCQTDGMCSSMWAVYFAQNGVECALDVDEQLEKDIKSIRRAIKKLKRQAGEGEAAEA